MNLLNFLFLVSAICFTMTTLMMAVSVYENDMTSILLTIDSVLSILQGFEQTLLMVTVINFVWVPKDSVIWTFYWMLFFANAFYSIFDLWVYANVLVNPGGAVTKYFVDCNPGYMFIFQGIICPLASEYINFKIKISFSYRKIKVMFRFDSILRLANRYSSIDSVEEEAIFHISESDSEANNSMIYKSAKNEDRNQEIGGLYGSRKANLLLLFLSFTAATSFVCSIFIGIQEVMNWVNIIVFSCFHGLVGLISFFIILFPARFQMLHRSGFNFTNEEYGKNFLAKIFNFSHSFFGRPQNNFL